MTFVGGEPLLHPALLPLLKECKAAGLTTCVVTNASILDSEFLKAAQPHLDWLTMSIDASSDALHSALGRGLRKELLSSKCGTPLSPWHLIDAHTMAVAAESDV
eukprot:jgi/Ulvmu1/7432/UM036_0093.1